MAVAPRSENVASDPVPVTIAGGGGSLPTGAATEAKQDTQITDLGGVTETAPASDTASSGLNGRLQRVAQRLTSLIALLPASLGQKAKASALAVTLASDEDLLATAGAVADAIVAAGATGSISAKLRRVTQGLEDLKTLLVLGAGENHVGAVGGALTVVAGVEFTRPANTTAYTAGDVVSNDATTTVPITVANAVRVSGGSGYVVGARLWTDLKSVTPRIRVHLFNASNATLAGDNLAMKTLYTEIGKRIATFDLAAMTTPADTSNSTLSGATDFTLRIPFVAVGGRDIYAVLETLDAFTPASGEKFSLVLTVDQN